MNITVIGGGNMGLTYAQSIHTNFANSIISIAEKNEEKAEILKKETPFNVFANAEDCIKNAEIVLLAIKPQVAQAVFRTIKEFVNPNQIVISIMAGVTIKTISEGLNIDKVVRAMPNLPAQVREGVTGYIASDNISNFEKACVQGLLSSTGTAIELENETAIDAITALSGSGPAYVFYFMNAMIEYAEGFGFNKSDAKSIVLNTFKGTVNLFEKSETEAEIWMDRVTSKGGTTHAALTAFNEFNVKNNIKKGVQAAFNRAQELGKK